MSSIPDPARLCKPGVRIEYLQSGPTLPFEGVTRAVHSVSRLRFLNTFKVIDFGPMLTAIWLPKRLKGRYAWVPAGKQDELGRY